MSQSPRTVAISGYNVTRFRNVATYRPTSGLHNAYSRRIVADCCTTRRVSSDEVAGDNDICCTVNQYAGSKIVDDQVPDAGAVDRHRRRNRGQRGIDIDWWVARAQLKKDGVVASTRPAGVGDGIIVRGDDCLAQRAMTVDSLIIKERIDEDDAADGLRRLKHSWRPGDRHKRDDAD